MFELTDTLTYVVPVMIAALVAKTVADALEPKGIYDLVIELSQLPYLDAKHEYIWGAFAVSDVTERHVETIHAEQSNTVKSLRDKLQRIVSAGYHDSGFPIVRSEVGGLKMVGYIGVNELEHALTIVADDANATCLFHSFAQHNVDNCSVSSLETPVGTDPFDFTVYMDQAPLTVQTHSPLELVQQLFVKLGARYVVVTNADGFYEGVIEKKAWLAFLKQLEDKH